MEWLNIWRAACGRASERRRNPVKIAKEKALW
jgi:hypothetical protein